MWAGRKGLRQPVKDSMNHEHPPRKSGKLLSMAPPQLVTDPVCGMHIDPATAAGQWDHKGTRYYFCNPGCLQKFKADPEKYLQPALQAGSGKLEAGSRKLEAEASNTPVRCIPRSCAPGQVHARSAAWRSSRGSRHSTRGRILN